MTSVEIISLIVTIIGLVSFSTIFTLLYKSYTSSQISEIKSGKRDIELVDEVIYEKKLKAKKSRKVFRIVRLVLFYLILVILVPFFIFSLINKFKNNVTMIGNKTIMVVASGSMSEKNKANNYLQNDASNSKLNYQFKTYDIIILEKVENASDLSLYDVVAYVNDEGINVIHRIIKIENGTYETRGDANSQSDTYHCSFDDIIGKYNGKKINGVGVFIMFLQSYSGIITIVSLIYCLLMIDNLSNKLNNAQLERLKMLEDAIDYSNETSNLAMEAKFIETIYYKGYAYQFDENGFIDKNEISDSSYLEKSNDTIIKEVMNKETLEVTEKTIVLNDNSQGE